MDWTRAFDGYCERTDASYWSEPVNALTNLAFLIVAVFMWRRSRGHWPALFLSGLLFAIGVGSWLFHTHATAWAAVLDVLPILLFSLAYTFLVNRDFLGWPFWAAAIGAAAFIPYSAIAGAGFAALPFVSISASYWPLPLLIFIYAFVLRRSSPVSARNLALGALVLCISLIFRSVDASVCAVVPMGTHFVWHLLNAVMLAWMIETWLRHKISAA